MPLIIIFFIWYGIYGRNNPKIYSKLHNKLGWVIAICILFGGLSGFSSLFGGLLAVSIVIAFFGAPIWLVAWFDRKIIQRKSKSKTG